MAIWLVALAGVVPPAPLAAQSAAPATAASTTGPVYPSSLMTRWGRAVTPANAWRSYPRPQMTRSAWQNLNGEWDYAITGAAAPQPAAMAGKILVPFPVESQLSGVRRAVLPENRIWYRRLFAVPADWSGQHVLLHFDAVDYQAAVWVNGAYVGGHRGGSNRFSFDVTSYLRAGGNGLVVQVADPTSDGGQPRGKQSLHPEGIWYTPVSGIWQTVWLEPVPQLHIEDVRATPDIDRGVLDVDVALSGSAADTDAVRLTARSQGRTIASAIIRANRHATLAIPGAHLWSPDDPFLYDLTAELVQVADPYAGGQPPRAGYDNRFTEREAGLYAQAKPQGPPVDRVETYFAMRKVSIGPGPVHGQPAILLNNKPVFENGTLDQGWWPDGLLTPPSEEAMKSDLLFLKRAGFNMVRKHIKVEPARFYYDADHLGMLVWQDMPSGGGEDQFVTGSSQSQAVLPSSLMTEDEVELARMIGDLRAFPSIVLWVVNNEGWGQFDSRTLAQFVKNTDPSRLVDADTGWLDVAPGVSDVFDIHTYEEAPRVPTRQSARAIVIGEFGGIGLPLPGHLWHESKRNWGYQVARDADDYLARYRVKFAEVIRQAKENGLSASVYTQTTDVEDEVNGLLTYDRAMPKAQVDKLAEIVAPLHPVAAP